jgi:hypothetical protein
MCLTSFDVLGPTPGLNCVITGVHVGEGQRYTFSIVHDRRHHS